MNDVQDRFDVDWELILGGNWLARIGILTVVIGIGFFLKLAFDNAWIGPTGRVVLGLIVGVGFLGAAEYWRARYAVYAQALAGGGIAILYLAIFSAFSFYGMVGYYQATAFLALVSVTAVVMSLRFNSVGLAIIGIVGAFGAPFILGISAPDRVSSVASDNGVQLLVYAGAVTLGVLVLVTLRRWPLLTILGFLGAMYSFGSWYAGFGQDVGTLGAQLAITGFFLLFVAATTLFHLVWRRMPGTFDYLLMVLNAVAYFGISYALLWADFRDWVGGFTLALAAFYGIVAYASLARRGRNVPLSLMGLGIGLILATIAVPVQLGGPWISVAWASEAAVLMWLSSSLRLPRMREASIGVFVIFLIWLVGVDTPAALDAAGRPFLNLHFLPYAFGAVAGFFLAYMVRQTGAFGGRVGATLSTAFIVSANAILTLAVPLQVSGTWIAITWTIEAFVFVWLSRRLGLYEMRFAGLGVLLLAAVRLFLYDTTAPSTEVTLPFLDSFQPVLNVRFLAFLLLAVTTAGTGVMLRNRVQDLYPWERAYLFAMLIGGANLVALWGLSVEVLASINSGLLDMTRDTAQSVKSLSLSILWAIYGSIALAVGIMKGLRNVRVGGLVVLAIPVLKLFLVDAFQLEQVYRVIAFVGLGGLLLVGGFLYQRFTSEVRNFFLEDSHASS